MSEITKRRYTDPDSGIEMVEETILDTNGEVCGRATYPYISPEEQEEINKQLEAQRLAEEQARLDAIAAEKLKQQMQENILAQIFLNQATLTAALKEKGVIE